MSDRVKKLKAIRFDGWANSLTGLGTTRDKSLSSFFAAGFRVDDETAELMFAEDDLASLICEAMPEYALRKTPKVKLKPSKEDEKKKDEMLREELQQTEADINDALDGLDTVENLEDGTVWANVFGGSAIMLGLNDGAEGEKLREPLNEDGIQSFTHLSVVDRRYLTPLEWYDNPREPKFGTPKTYLFTPYAMTASTSMADLENDPQIFEIHETRLVLFGGVRTSISRKQESNGWDDSLLTRVNTTLKQFGTSWDMLPYLLQDANQGVFKMDGYIDALAADEEGVIQKRLEFMDMNRSQIRGLILDAGTEEFTRQQFNWAGIKEPYELMQARVSMAAKTPITLLFGRSPAGMNATGESDLSNFDSKVASYQVRKLKSAFERIAYLLMKSKDGPTKGVVPDNWEADFPILRELTPEQDANIKNTMSAADKNYIDSGVLQSEEVAVSRFGPDGYSTNTTINLQSRVVPEIPEDLEVDANEDIEPNIVEEPNAENI